MRQVFTSARLENVEGVAKLLESEGIEVRITNGRSYKGGIRGNFSYADKAAGQRQPALWIVRSEDQPRARELLRAAGLLGSTRMPGDSYLGPTVHDAAGGKSVPASRRRAFLIKLGLLVVIAVVIALLFLGARNPRQAAPPARAGAGAAANAALSLPGHVLPTPPALAEMLVAVELEAQAPARACLALDGKDMPPASIARLQRPGTRMLPSSACDGVTQSLSIEVAGYRTDGSGTGTVQLDMSHVDRDGERQDESRILEVERTGERWRVLRML